MAFLPSPQQSAVIDWVRNGRGSAFVEAVAGAGKTTTLIQAVLETQGSVAYCAFNKKIVKEIEGKIAEYSNPKSERYDARFVGIGNRFRMGTFHSFGYGAWRRVHPDVKLDARAKNDKILLAIECPQVLSSFVLKLISLAKQAGLGLFGSITDLSFWYDTIDHFDLSYDIEDPDHIAVGVELAIAGLRESQRLAPELIDFDDMIYMPVLTGCRMWENDWVLVDEAQDTNPARRAMARKMLKRNGRAIFVGDRHQAIYGFTGADSDAVDQIIRAFNCSSLPLTVTYRCPKTVVAVAQETVSHIQAHETAPEGKVWELPEANLVLQQKTGELGLGPKDAILCRNTKPLVQMAYSLIRIGTACHVEGKDIGQGLLKLVNRFSARTMDQLFDRLDAYADRECEKLVAKGRETQAEALRDRVETVKVVAEGCKSVDELRGRISDMFLDSDSEARPTLTLSTVHKAKGREWNRVFILGYTRLMPSPYARQAWQLQQENNLKYVAVTRAQQELILVE